MATQLFKDGESIMVEARQVQKHIAAGWSPDDPNAPTLQIRSPRLQPRDGETVDDAALRAMGIHAKPTVGAMHVPV